MGGGGSWKPVMFHLLAGDKLVPFANLHQCALRAEYTHPGPLLQPRL